MKRRFTLLATMLLAGALAFGQTGGDKSKTDLNPQPLPPGRHPVTATKTKKGGKKGNKGLHKGSTKGKKGGSSTTPPKSTQPSTPPK